MKDYEIKINVKSEAKTTQQKGRRVLIHLHEQVDEVIEKLLKDGFLRKLIKFKTMCLFNQQ